jgi:predicted metal-dependent HD superfamily phosphohydrolase
MDTNLLKHCEKFVRDIFLYSDKNYYYHNIKHIEEVVENVSKICSHLNISDEEEEIVLIAAWFHDSYYVTSHKNHEFESAKIAENFLLKHNYPQQKIDQVKNCILATRIPQSPKNKLEEILCDADLFHIGTEHFFSRNELYKQEIKDQFSVNVSDRNFIKNTIDFFSKHKFFSLFAKNYLEKVKRQNIHKLKQQLENYK